MKKLRWVIAEKQESCTKALLERDNQKQISSNEKTKVKQKILIMNIITFQFANAPFPTQKNSSYSLL